MKALIERDVFTALQPAIGVTASPVPMIFGNDAQGTSPLTAWDFLEFASWGGTPSDANLIALVNAIRTQARIPTSPVGITLRHRSSVPDAIGALAVSTGYPVPALPDTVTGAAIDVAEPVGGTPTVVAIDPSTDGRVTYGYVGFSALSYLATSLAQAFAGSGAGFHVLGVVTPASLAGTVILACCLAEAAPLKGWYVHLTGGVLRFVVLNTIGVPTVSATYTLSNADLHRPLWWGAQLTATGALRLFVRGAQAGSDVQISGIYAPATTVPLRIGFYWSGSPQPFDGVFWGLAAGGDVTASEIVQAHADYEAKGLVQAIGGKSTRLYQPSVDMAAAGGRTSSLTQIVDRIGTHHLSRVGTGPVIDTGRGNGLRGLGTDYVYVTRGSAIAAQTINLYVDALIYVRSGTVYAPIVGTTQTTAKGWTFGVHGDGVVYVQMGSPSGTRGFSTPAGAATMNAWHHVAFTIDASGSGRIYLNGYLRVSSNGMSFTADPVGEFKILGAEPTTIAGVSAAFPTIPTASEITTAAAAALATMRIQTIPGKTVRLWSPPDDVATDRNVVGLWDRAFAGGMLDSMVLTNPPLQVSERKEALWSFDTAPTAYGIRGLSDANYYWSAGAIMPGHAGSFWCTVSFSLESLVGNRIFLSSGNWNVRAPDMYVYFDLFDASSTFRASPAIGPSVRELGKILTLTGVYDAQALKLRLYYRRMEVGTGSASGGGLMAPGPFFLGRAEYGYSANDMTIYGIAYGHGAPAAHLIAAHHDAAAAKDGRLSAIPGLTAHLYDLTADAIAGGGTIGAMIVDRQGVNHLTRVGSPTTYARYSRTLGL